MLQALRVKHSYRQDPSFFKQHCAELRAKIKREKPTKSVADVLEKYRTEGQSEFAQKQEEFEFWERA
jgi:hypothetical protein